jgi:hypothetical protein
LTKNGLATLWAERFHRKLPGGGCGFLLNKTPIPSPMGLKIGQSTKSWKIEPLMPEGPEKLVVDFCRKI